jgi:S1-C subfamily serine protease
MRPWLAAAMAIVILPATMTAAAERSLAARVYVQAAGAGVHGVADSVKDVQKVLAEQRPDSLLSLADSREQADIILEVMGRHTENKMDYTLTPPMEMLYSIVIGAVLDGDRSTAVQAESGALIKSWSEAAKSLVSTVAGYVEHNHHELLRRRADWPALGFEFEELTKERKKQFGVKDGKVVVTAVTAGGAGEKAGLRAGDVIATLDGEKVKKPAKLAREIYARGGGTTLSLGVVQGGANRTISLLIP